MNQFRTSEGIGAIEVPVREESLDNDDRDL
jgi:hypothetical protein